MANSKRTAEMDEIWSIFAQEGKENLALAEEALLKLEQAPDDLEQVQVLFRAIHSFKGGARMMGLAVVESLAHHAEDLLALVRDNGVTLESDMIDLLLAVTDRLRSMLDQVLAAGCDVAPEQAAGLIEDLQRVISSHAPTPQNEPAASNPVSAEALPPIETAPTTEPEPAGTPSAAEPAESLDRPATAKSNLLAPTGSEALADFLEITETGLSQLHAALDAFATGPLEASAQIQQVANNLRVAAERLGYQRLVSLLDDLAREAGADARTDAATNEKEESLLRLKNVELEIFEELTQIQDQAAPPESAAASNWTDIAWLFRHWNAERVYADLARLSKIADALEQLTHQLTLEVSISQQDQKLAEEAMIRLRAIYHSSIFYHLDQAVHLTLAMQDIYARIAQGELVANEALVRLTRIYVTNLGGTIDAVREGETPELAFAGLIEQAQNYLYLHADGPVFEVTRNVLDVLDLPADFKQVMTPETMTAFRRALQAGEHFYTLLADLERDEALGAAFLEWSHSKGIRLITNVTVYRYNRTLFNFLFATIHPRETILESLEKMDPQWQYLTLRACSIRPEVDPQKAQVAQAESGTLSETETGTRADMAVSNRALDDLIDIVGAMMADHATLHRVTERLANVDLAQAVLQIAQAAQGNWEQARLELQRYLGEWIDGIGTVAQVETQMGVALGQLQESARSLRRAPTAEMLNPLRRMVQELTSRQGCLVELDLQGTELELDRDTIQALTEPIRRLVWFAVTQGIEDVEKRRAVGKSSAGRIVVKVSAYEDHAEVSVEDDGCGLDRASILSRARELGWGKQTVTEELDFVLRPGFGLVSRHDQAEGIDLAAIATALRAHQGHLRVTSEIGKGTRFEIRLPLDMAVVDGMVVRVGAVRYVVPVNAIRRIVKPEAAHLVHSSAEGSTSLLRFEEEIVPIRSLTGQANGHGEYNLLMIVENEQKRLALAIDELIGRQQVLVRPLQGQLADVQDVSGCALLGEGEVGMVLQMSFDSNHGAGGMA